MWNEKYKRNEMPPSQLLHNLVRAVAVTWAHINIFHFHQNDIFEIRHVRNIENLGTYIVFKISISQESKLDINNNNGLHFIVLKEAFQLRAACLLIRCFYKLKILFLALAHCHISIQTHVVVICVGWVRQAKEIK